MEILNYRKLFEPYAKKITLEGLADWLLKEASRRHISTEVVELAITQAFFEIQGGKEFPKDGCTCGCELNNPHSALAHYLRVKMINLHQKTLVRFIDNMQNRLIRQVETSIKQRQQKKHWIYRLFRWIGLQ